MLRVYHLTRNKLLDTAKYFKVNSKTNHWSTVKPKGQKPLWILDNFNTFEI